MSEIKVAFWNVQNLFDTKVSEIAADLEYTPANGWDQKAYDAKVKNLAEVLKGLHGGKGADLLGLCEVENLGVVQDLVGKLNRPDYKIAHVQTPDIRGIDCSLVYSGDLFKLVGTPVGHLIHLRYPTRDIFQVRLKMKPNGPELVVLVNHWPSRSRGLYETEPYRITVASRCGRIVDGLLKYPRKEYLVMPDTKNTLNLLNKRWDSNILLMGDFNDEPFNRSILDELKASSGTDKLEEPIKKSSKRKTPSPKDYLQEQAYLFNCMWSILGMPDTGSYYYSGSTNTMNVLDQFIISRGLHYGLQGLATKPGSVQIARPNCMTSGKKKRPVAFDKKSQKGYSDHFPITGVLVTV
jgi:hypothetical protein